MEYTKEELMKICPEIASMTEDELVKLLLEIEPALDRIEYLSQYPEKREHSAEPPFTYESTSRN